MKVRTSFVTNSSSSSFIMAFNNSDRWTSYEYFKEICDKLDYNDFYNLIDNISSDYLVFGNCSDRTISIRPLIDKINPVDFGAAAYIELTKIYDENYQLKPYETCSIKINDLKNNQVDLDRLGFEDIDEDNYSIYIRRNDENRSKEKASENLYQYYAWVYKWTLLKEYGDLDWKERKEIEESAEFKEKLKSCVEQDEEYKEKKKKLEDADFVVNGTIWDTNGGILEWAIRNDFIKQNFYNNHIYTLHVG